MLGLGCGMAADHVNGPPAGLTVVYWAEFRTLYEKDRQRILVRDRDAELLSPD